MSRREDVAKAALDVGMLRTYIGLWEASTSELSYLYDAAFRAGAEAEREVCERDIEDCRGVDDSAEYSNGISTALAAIRARGAK